MLVMVGMVTKNSTRSLDQDPSDVGKCTHTAMYIYVHTMLHETPW